MASPIRLSVCIPTYNFGAFIGETLESIIRQATEEIEIVVLDGGSTDDTPEIVARHQQSFPRLHYVRMPEKGGIDHDMALSAEHAHGEYCWFFSADDWMAEGAIAEVLRRLPDGDDLILVEETSCTRDMRRIVDIRNLSLREERTFELSDPGQLREYCALAVNTQAFLSFCGGFVFRRDRWMASDWDRSFIGSCWAHAARLLALIPTGLRVRHVPRSLTLKRGDNDSFLTHGIARRIAISVDGYSRMAESLFGAGTFEADQIRRVLRREFDLVVMGSAKIVTIEEKRDADLPLLHSLFGRIYGERAPLTFLYRHIPRFVWLVMGRVRVALKRLLGR